MKKLLSLLCFIGVALPFISSAEVVGDFYWRNSSAVTGSKEELTLNDLKASSVRRAEENKTDPANRVRLDAVQEAAAAYGAQVGLAMTAKRYNSDLLKKKIEYDKIYNFEAVLLEPGLLPPVITEGKDSYNQTGSSFVRAADMVYKIEFDAQFVNTPPLWETYLIQADSIPEKPSATLLPKTKEESLLWDEWVERGYAAGVEQARLNFDSNLARLNRDYLGMWRYKKLYSQGLVVKPVVARSNLGVTGGGRELAVNDRVVSIAQPAALNPDQTKWLTPNPK